jgi:hypothetical protein
MTLQSTNSDSKAMAGNEPAEESVAPAWLPAGFADGGGFVCFPAAFDAFTETEGDEIRHVLECYHGDYKKFLARKYVFPDARKAGKKYRKIKDNYGFFADQLTESTCQSNPSFAASLSNSGECGEVFAVRVKSAIFLLIVSDNETPDCPNLEAMSRRFFDSLLLN